MKKIILVKIIFLLSLIACVSQKNKDLILGYWRTSPDENVEFIITKNNIEYFDTGYLHEYKLSKNHFLVLDSGKVVLKFKLLKITSDSLILQILGDGENRGTKYKYYKVKD
jgi:hypothetical protein